MLFCVSATCSCVVTGTRIVLQYEICIVRLLKDKNCRGNTYIFYMHFLILEFKYKSLLAHTWLQHHLSPALDCCSVTSLPHVVVIFPVREPEQYPLSAVLSADSPFPYTVNTAFWVVLVYLIHDN